MAKHKGIAYLRTTRKDTPIIYRADEVFSIGGSKTLKSNKADVAAVVAAGITLHEALKAYEELKNEGIYIRVIDLYSVKPVDKATLIQAANDTGVVVTVEDHYAEGGLGEAVLSALAGNPVQLRLLAVRTIPRSGKPDELLDLAGISSRSIVQAVRELSGGKK
jgi:transketolase